MFYKFISKIYTPSIKSIKITQHIHLYSCYKNWNDHTEKHLHDSNKSKDSNKSTYRDPSKLCKFCEGSGVTMCQNCKGTGRYHRGVMEYRCICKNGTKLCNFCGGDGKPYDIF